MNHLLHHEAKNTTPYAMASIWLMGLLLLLWGMVMLGGATRLTQSGLSMVEWKPLTGILPPLNKVQWQEAFSKYKQFPEYIYFNTTMSLSEFKFIYLMEYAHRVLGRIIGLWFFIPFAFMWKSFSSYQRRLGIFLGILGALQGLMGWYMVKSGLKDIPHVSHFRLAIHFMLAIAIITITLHFLFNMRRKVQKISLWSVYKNHVALTLLLAMTLTYGAFVAGLKAGLLYNTYPLMDGAFFPHISELMSTFEMMVYDSGWVQWIHRWMAIATFVAVLNAFFQTSQRWVCLVALGQVLLGICTLLYQVPVSLGTLHQGWAVIVWGSVYIGLFNLKTQQAQYVHSHNERDHILTKDDGPPLRLRA
jgi:cytochrome c oxidase assembly protein subunit 15